MDRRVVHLATHRRIRLIVQRMKSIRKRRRILARKAKSYQKSTICCTILTMGMWKGSVRKRREKKLYAKLVENTVSVPRN